MQVSLLCYNKNDGGREMNIFETDLKQLNSEQQEAVYTIERNTLVLAPAGTGKTKVIALRTAYLLEKGISPCNILNLTFTNKAAKEMEERIRLYAPEAITQLTIKTFHSFCYHLLNQEKMNTHFSFPCTIIDESDSQHIVTRILSALTKGEIVNSATIAYTIIPFIEGVKKHSLTFEPTQRTDYKRIVSSYFKTYPTKEPLLLAHGLRLIKMYQKHLRTSNSLDFIDLIVEATHLLEDEIILKKWQGIFKYIQVDEMQDTSSREYALIKKLAQGNYLTLYGDFNQTIYEWRGSSPIGMIEDFEKTCQPLTIELRTNYRSTQLLLNAANDYVRNSKLYPINCHAHATEKGEPIEILTAKDEIKEFRVVGESILHHLQKGETRIAVLTRLNKQAISMTAVCDQLGIDTVRVEEVRLFRKKAIKDFQAFFNYALNPRSSYSLERLLRLPLFNIEEWLLQELKSTQKNYLYLHDWFLAEHKDPYQPLFHAYEKNEIVVLDVESTGLDTTQDDIIQIAAIRYGRSGVMAKLDILVKPTKSVQSSYHIHHFTDEELQQKGIEPSHALDLLLQFIETYTLVGHNVYYDLSIIESMLSRYHKAPLGNHVVYDTLDLARKIYPHLANHKLDTLSELIQTEAAPNHNAYYDILATSEVLTHFMTRLATKQSERLEAIEAYYPYVEPYKTQLQSIISRISVQEPQVSIQELLEYSEVRMNYNEEEILQIQTYCHLAQQLYQPPLSIRDNLTKLLSFSALHSSEVEQSDLFKNKIPIMTIHQAKGLEFDIVYLIGCNNGIFPASRSVKSGFLTEEHRLFYVGMTRPKKKLYISYQTSKKISPFIAEISEHFKIYSQIE